ncbi:MAG: ABC-F family ATP-binding cassette domain-containing protein [Paludibacter sp.]|nr:ABC-F family ATP-binding cassette domain-containing protein [Bacteroidales bacterium]MCM1069608.1 ABC-F family ATP-binding cassette domain-containing protein [Prevotella sp.]MCM1354254.1 ABC-F family ATP-binding cassette domain-containing protein [Bacteroides sp.]MCM1443093.1 ABC-F family ATP-binding cassette domain-containing protein [Muribaculum sp.]MCM1482328.1 ABC-F family ATP-binding cassette domain-containing protein [Paludibacter sp.]
MITIEHLSMEFASKPILEDISFLINRKDKVALVGKNGAGKTTLLRLIAGEYKPTRGSIAYQKDISIGYLPQQMIHAEGTTVREEARKAFKHVLDIQDQINTLSAQLAERTDYESQEYQTLIDQLTHDNELLQILGGQNFDGEMEKTLLGLGFSRSDMERPCNEFSGGWRMRIELAKILLQSPDILLLDEPTNHLDIESIQWLEQFLMQSRSAVLLVSHDRAFIDNVTNRTIEISLGHIYDYNVNYSHFVELRKERHEQQMRAWENQQKLIQETEDFIERFRYKATKAVQVQSRIKQLEKLERIEVDQEDNSRLRLRFPPAPRSGDYPVIIEGLRKDFGTHTVFSDVRFTLKRGDKVAFVGKNGEGKTTLVRCLMNQLDYEGTLKIGHNVKIGYFAQNQASLLDENLSVFETIDYVATGDIRTKIRDILGAFMFGGEASEKKVKVLSGGERSRLAMIRLLLEPVNLLILDEPTNHLDMRSKDVLKEALAAFDGTLIVVSHDRYFLDGLVEKVYEFGGGKVVEHIGSVYDFLRKKRIDNLQELERKFQTPCTTTPTNQQGKQDYAQQKAEAAAKRKKEKLIAETEAEIAKLEEAQKAIEELLALPDNQTQENFQRYEHLKHEIEQKLYEWEILNE